MSLIRRDIKSIVGFTIKMVVVWVIAFLFLSFIRTYGLEKITIANISSKINLANEITLAVFIGVITGFNGLVWSLCAPDCHRESDYARWKIGVIAYSHCARPLF